LKVADLRTGSVVVELQTPLPFDIFAVQWSPDGRMIAAVGWGGSLVVWDAHDGHVVFTGPMYPDRAVSAVVFTPDSRHLVVSYFATVDPPIATGRVEMLSTETWTAGTTTHLDPSVVGDVTGMGFVGFTPDGSTLLAVGGLLSPSESLLWLDAATLQVKDPTPVKIAQSIRSTSLSPDGSSWATAGADGVLVVWDAKTGRRKQQMEFRGSRVQGVAFIDESHLAVTPYDGNLLIMTVDHAELADIVRASLTRTFTVTECTTYGIEPCPTLEKLRAP
jgi:WD40 repeat protein